MIAKVLAGRYQKVTRMLTNCNLPVVERRRKNRIVNNLVM
jgi:hypothetical protein